MTIQDQLLADLLKSRLPKCPMGIIVDGIAPDDLRAVIAFLRVGREDDLFVCVAGAATAPKLPGVTFTGEIEQAIAWRNLPECCGSIIVVLPHEVPKGRSLAAFDRLTSRHLSVHLLEKAEKHIARNEVEREVFQALTSFCKEVPLALLEQLVSEVEGGKKVDRLAKSLHLIGLVRDDRLLDTKCNPLERLERNRNAVEQLNQLSEQSRRRMAEVTAQLSGGERKKMSSAYNAAMNFFRRGDQSLLKDFDLEVVEQLIKHGKTIHKSVATEDGDDADPLPPPPERPLRGHQLEQALAESIVSANKGDQEALAVFADSLQRLYDEPEEASEQISLGDRATDVGWTADQLSCNEALNFCCTEASWGGWFSTEQPRIADAFRTLAPQDFNSYSPSVASSPGEYTLETLLSGFDAALGGRLSNFQDLIARLTAARTKLCGSVKMLMQYPLVLLRTDATIRKAVSAYLDLYSELLATFRKHEAQLHIKNAAAVKVAASQLLRLDVVHGQCKGDWKAMLTPLHPLYLWRYREIIKAIDAGLPEADREQLAAVLPDLPQVLHFLVSSPGPSGTDPLILPLAGQIHELPTYENHTNRYLGNDGIDFLGQAARLWLRYAPYTKMQLRIAVVDCPDVRHLLREVREFQADLEIDQVVLDLYSTEERAVAMNVARLELDSADYGIIEALREGRILLSTSPLSDSNKIGEKLKSRPVHLLAAFDQGEFDLHHASRARDLVVSPLVVTYQYEYDGILRRGKIAPSSDSEDGIFSDFHFVVRALAELPPGKLPRLENSEPANVLTLSETLTNGTAKWLICADRTLASYRIGGGVKLTEQICGQREVGIWASPSEQMFVGISQTLSEYSLFPTTQTLRTLFDEFGHIAKAGWPYLLETGRASSASADKQKKGALGTIIAASWYCKTYPDALVAPLDSPLARQWLLGRKDGQARADLVGVRLDNTGRVFIEPIEVKSHAVDSDIRARKSPDGKGMKLEGHAVDQLKAMLTVLASVFGGADQQPLFTPARREALKYQLFRECFRDVPDKERPQRWYERLQDVFTLPRPKVEVELNAMAIVVRFEELGDVSRVRDASLGIEMIQIGTREIQRLLEGDDGQTPPGCPPPIGPRETPPAAGGLKSSAGEKVKETTADNVIEKPTSDKSRSKNKKTAELAANENEHEELEELATAFRRGCQSFSIDIAECSANKAIVGPNVLRFYIRLGRGQRLADLRRSLEDIGREMSRTGLVITGIEHSDQLALDVPRKHRSTVNISKALENIPAVEAVNNLPIPIGITPEGKLVIRDLSTMPHLIVGGTTGAGKTVFLYGLLAALLQTHPGRDQLRVILSSSKKEDFSVLKGLAHLEGGSVIDDANGAITMLQGRVQEQIAERKELLDQAGCRDIVAYNKTQSKPMIPIVIVIDEFADLADQLSMSRRAKNDFYTCVRQVAQAGRSRGVHLVLCTQRPSSQLVPSDIRSLMNFRIAFRVNKREDSQMILDDSGAEHLQMHGDLLFKDDKSIQRALGFFTDVQQLEEIVTKCASKKKEKK